MSPQGGVCFAGGDLGEDVLAEGLADLFDLA